jgi:hypothetical protein
MTLLGGSNSGDVIRKKSIGGAIGSTSCARSRSAAASPSFFQRMMKSITTLSF